MRFASLCILLFSPCSTVCGKNISVLVFGDSWGALDPSWHALQEMFDRHGVSATVKSSAIGGTRACQWAENPQALKEKAMALFPESGPDFLWYTAGGNDMENQHYQKCSAEAANFDAAVECMKRATQTVTDCTDSMLQPLWEAFPAVKVMQCGYDIACEEGRCSSVAATRAPYCRENKTCENMMTQEWQPLLLTPLEQKYPKLYTGISILGAVQSAGGILGATVGSPNMSVGSPCSLMKYCVHPQNEGAVAVTEAFWGLYFSKHVPETILV